MLVVVDTDIIHSTGFQHYVFLCGRHAVTMRAPVVDYQLPVEPEPCPVIGLQPEQVAARFGRFEFPCPCYLVILYVDIVGGTVPVPVEIHDRVDALRAHGPQPVGLVGIDTPQAVYEFAILFCEEIPVFDDFGVIHVLVESPEVFELLVEADNEKSRLAIGPCSHGALAGDLPPFG